MKRRDEQFKEELRWRNEAMAAENKKIEENLATELQQRDEEWREDLSNRDKALRAELKERGKAFVQDQLKRDQELIKLIEVGENECSRTCFRRLKPYLYKEHHKEIKATIQRRDEELESILN